MAAAVMPGVLALTAGCARPPDGNGAAQVVACTERSGPLASEVRARDLAGSYRLALVATSGDSAGSRAEGQLTLAPNDSVHTVVRGMGTDDPRPNVATPLYGWSDLAARSVGAVNTGSLRASDPDAPGVLVIEGRTEETGAPPDIILRLGEYSNDRDRVLFDGGYTVLRVSWIESGAFGGSWESAAMNRGSARGYFCVQPTP
jgi:hypothetical protein